MRPTTHVSAAASWTLTGLALAALGVAAVASSGHALPAIITTQQVADDQIPPITAPPATVEFSSTSEVTALDFARIEQSDPNAPHGSETVLSEGRDGTATSVTLVANVDGRSFGPGYSITIETPADDEVVAIGTSPLASDRAGNRAIGQDLAAKQGWTGSEWNCLNLLWNRESGWSHTADNPNSSAYGIPQALPGSKMSVMGADWATNPATQIRWGLAYVAGRYGTPCAAWAHSEDIGWY